MTFSLVFREEKQGPLFHLFSGRRNMHDFFYVVFLYERTSKAFSLFFRKNTIDE